MDFPLELSNLKADNKKTNNWIGKDVFRIGFVYTKSETNAFVVVGVSKKEKVIAIWYTFVGGSFRLSKEQTLEVNKDIMSIMDIVEKEIRKQIQEKFSIRYEMGFIRILREPVR